MCCVAFVGLKRFVVFWLLSVGGGRFLNTIDGVRWCITWFALLCYCFVVRVMLFVVCCSWLVECCFGDHCCSLLVVGCLLFVVRCLLFDDVSRLL